MKRAELREIASGARDASALASRPGEEISQEQKREILIEYAAEHGLAEEELSAAIAAFGQTEHPKDRGIAAYLAGEYASAEVALRKAVDEQESDYEHSPLPGESELGIDSPSGHASRSGLSTRIGPFGRQPIGDAPSAAFGGSWQ